MSRDNFISLKVYVFLLIIVTLILYPVVMYAGDYSMSTADAIQIGGEGFILLTSVAQKSVLAGMVGPIEILFVQSVVGNCIIPFFSKFSLGNDLLPALSALSIDGTISYIIIGYYVISKVGKVFEPIASGIEYAESNAGGIICPLIMLAQILGKVEGGNQVYAADLGRNYFASPFFGFSQIFVVLAVLLSFWLYLSVRVLFLCIRMTFGIFKLSIPFVISAVYEIGKLVLTVLLVVLSIIKPGLFATILLIVTVTSFVLFNKAIRSIGYSKYILSGWMRECFGLPEKKTKIPHAVKKFLEKNNIDNAYVIPAGVIIGKKYKKHKLRLKNKDMAFLCISEDAVYICKKRGYRLPVDDNKQLFIKSKQLSYEIYSLSMDETFFDIDEKKEIKFVLSRQYENAYIRLSEHKNIIVYEKFEKQLYKKANLI